MIYTEHRMAKIPPDCGLCSMPDGSGFCAQDHSLNVQRDILLETRNENCPLRYGSVMEWIDVRDRLPDFTGPVLVTVVDRKFNQDPAPEVKAATYKTKYKQFFRVTGNVIAWMPYPEEYRR